MLYEYFQQNNVFIKFFIPLSQLCYALDLFVIIIVYGINPGF